LKYLADPQSASRLVTAFKHGEEASSWNTASPTPWVKPVAQLLRKCRQVEDFLWPGAEHDWLEEIGMNNQDNPAVELLIQFRALVRRWQAATLLTDRSGDIIPWRRTCLPMLPGWPWRI